MKKILTILGGVAALGFSIGAYGATATTTFDVTFKVNKSCTVTAGPLVLAAASSTGLSTGDGEGTTSLDVNCSKDVAYKVGLLPSGGATDGTGTLAAQNTAPVTGNTDTVSYGLYSDSAMTAAWGNDDGTNTIGGTGSGAGATPLTVYGKVTGSVDVTPDDYKDEVTVTVTY